MNRHASRVSRTEGDTTMAPLSRRQFLSTVTTAGTAAAATAFGPRSVKAQPFRGTIEKSLYWGMLPKEMSVAGRFALIRRAGFAGVEIPTLETADEVAEFKEAAASTGVTIHSIMNQAHWKYPLSSDDPATVEKSIEGMNTSLHNARDLGAETVLLVPAVVNAGTSYRNAYDRSQVQLRRLLPLARDLNVVIAVENVWNKFLLSPLEFARYIDEIESPLVRAYFDVGNIALYGFPHDWIRTLGDRIVKLHIKGFDVKEKTFTNILDGTIDWLEVRRALSDINYTGWMGAELRGGDEAYLKDVNARMDKIIAGRA